MLSQDELPLNDRNFIPDFNDWFDIYNGFTLPDFHIEMNKVYSALNTAKQEVLNQSKIIIQMQRELEASNDIIDGVTQVKLFANSIDKQRENVHNILEDRLKNIKLLIQNTPNDQDLGTALREMLNILPE